MPDFKIGVVSHYYDKIGVAIIDLTGDLAIGDSIKIVKNSQETIEKVASMQIEHEKIQNAKKGQTVGVKLTQPVKKKAEVYLVKS